MALAPKDREGSCSGSRPSESDLGSYVDTPIEHVACGTELLSQGFPPDSLILVRSGFVKLQHMFPDGRGVILGIRGKGSLLGLAGALFNRAQQISAVTLGPCAISRVRGPEFRRRIGRDDELSWKVHLELAREIESGIDRAAGLACLTARERLGNFLAFVRAELPPVNGVIPLPLRDWELAQFLAITPTWMSQLIRERVGAGELLRREGRWVLSDSDGVAEPRARGSARPSLTS